MPGSEATARRRRVSRVARYGRPVSSPLHNIDPGARDRLTARFGREVGVWFDELPAVLTTLAERWGFELGPPIPRGSVSTVFRCQMAVGQRAVLKASPDRTRLSFEARALRAWRGPHTPGVIAFDERSGALLIEAIEHGTPLIDASAYPPMETVAELLASLHEARVSHAAYPTLEQRVDDLFSSSMKLYDRHPELTAVVALDVYERERSLAARLAHDDPPDVLLHGDLTPSNILDGGSERGLVAIDPAPCIGGGAFDAIDLVLWRADDLETIEARIEVLAGVTDVDPERLLPWCSAFAGMNALELSSQGSSPPTRIETLRALASQAEAAG
jgi:streptomycin 6-kinase